ncbi:MAG: hypothetical protein ABR530_03710 [Pyrinomonadaceae bacterium]
MKRGILFSLVLLSAALCVAAVTSADGVTKRIKFAKGKSSATVSGSVVRGDRDTYILGAKAGQKATVRITSIEKNAVFQIEGPSGDLLAGAGETDDAMTWSGSLPADGDYKVIVGGTRANASYRLRLSIR